MTDDDQHDESPDATGPEDQAPPIEIDESLVYIVERNRSDLDTKSDRD